MKIGRIVAFNFLLGVLFLVETGCAIGPLTFDPVQDALDDCSYKDSVNYYKSRGVSSREAQRAAFEDQFFEKAGRGQ